MNLRTGYRSVKEKQQQQQALRQYTKYLDPQCEIEENTNYDENGCKDSETCRANWKELQKQFPGLCDSENDTDYQFFHCEVKGCHDISLGKQSIQCNLCSRWICESHQENLEDHAVFFENDDYVWDNAINNKPVCVVCLRFLWKDLLQRYVKKLEDYKKDINLLIYEVEPIECKEGKCNAEGCHASSDVESCQQCRKTFCLTEHLLEYTNDLRCLLCARLHASKLEDFIKESTLSLSKVK